MNTFGVAVTELHCPTCGARYGLPLRIWPQVYDFENFDVGPRHLFAGSTRPYIVCSQGHKWTIKVIEQRRNEHTRFLLGEFIGHANRITRFAPLPIGQSR